MKIMKLVIGNSNNPYMTKVCTLRPVLNPHIKIDTICAKTACKTFETKNIGHYFNFVHNHCFLDTHKYKVILRSVIPGRKR
jgi:hypothetical protein